MKVDDMTEDEFKITVRAFYPNIQFKSFDRPEWTEHGVDPNYLEHVVISDYLMNDKYVLLDTLRYCRQYNGETSIWYGAMEYDDLSDLVKCLKDLGWYRLFDKYGIR